MFSLSNLTSSHGDINIVFIGKSIFSSAIDSYIPNARPPPAESPTNIKLSFPTFCIMSLYSGSNILYTSL